MIDIRMGALLVWLLAAPLSAAGQQPEAVFFKARVERIVTTTERGEPVQDVQAVLLSGPQRGETVRFTNAVMHERADLLLHEGETIVVQHVTRPDGSVSISLQEKYRLPALGIFTVLFLLLGMLVGGRRGFTSIVGLAVSIGFLVLVLFPLILRGWNPLPVCAAGSAVLAGAMLYLAHGFNRRTTVALIATIIVLAAAVLFSVLAVHFSALFGLGSEEGMFLQRGLSPSIDARGLLMGGIIIGALGVLDDITTAQVAAIAEVSGANPSFGFRQLYRSGIVVGREHVASMINTLALAYIGAALPLFLLLFLNKEFPLWVTLNSAFLAEEVVRTFVGSAALLLAVPVSTWLAARAFAGGLTGRMSRF